PSLSGTRIRSFLCTSFHLTALRTLGHDIYQGRESVFLDYFHSPFERRSKITRFFNRPFGVDAEPLGDLSEIGGRTFNLDTNHFVLHRPSASLGHHLLMLLIIVVGSVITHHGQQRDLMVSRSVERAGHIEKVSVRLKVHANLARIS